MPVLTFGVIFVNDGGCNLTLILFLFLNQVAKEGVQSDIFELASQQHMKDTRHYSALSGKNRLDAD